MYNSATLDKVNSNPTTVFNQVNNSDAPLCMSCHDGGSMAGGLLNPPASNGNLQPAFAGGAGFLDHVTGNADLGSDLTNDHPIGMDYAAVQGADTAGFKVIGNVTLPFYSYAATSNVMWCSTCHDVHGEGGGDPFLNMSNSGSALCVECHNK
jgi:predicted CXXCH cytochrome family protein